MMNNEHNTGRQDGRLIHFPLIEGAKPYLTLRYAIVGDGCLIVPEKIDPLLFGDDVSVELIDGTKCVVSFQKGQLEYLHVDRIILLRGKSLSVSSWTNDHEISASGAIREISRAINTAVLEILSKREELIPDPDDEPVEEPPTPAQQPSNSPYRPLKSLGYRSDHTALYNFLANGCSRLVIAKIGDAEHAYYLNGFINNRKTIIIAREFPLRRNGSAEYNIEFNDPEEFFHWCNKLNVSYYDELPDETTQATAQEGGEG